MIDGLTNADAVPVLERLMQFTAQRHRIIANNIANLSTPGFRPMDVSIAQFQEQLGRAIDARRTDCSNHQRLTIESTSEVEVTDQSLALHPQPRGDNILFHDGNDRDVERTMQSLVENFTMFRTAAQLMRNRLELLNTAIRERI
jgi:flagellar basal-body rod protein FlgB